MENINAKELMIGNVVNRTNKQTKESRTICLTASCILDIHANGKNSSFIYEPVLLSEGILNEINIYKDKSTQMFDVFGCDLDSQNDVYFDFYFCEYGDWHKSIEHVHELQNLSFFISGKHLDVSQLTIQK